MTLLSWLKRLTGRSEPDEATGQMRGDRDMAGGSSASVTAAGDSGDADAGNAGDSDGGDGGGDADEDSSSV